MKALLFTDIEGSTTLWERDPGAMAAALATHDRILRDAIESRGGVVFTTAGDSFAAAYAEPAVAIATAVAVQRALGHETWTPETPIRVRIGIHVGVTVERDGDHFGPAVNRAARVCDAGHGGQVLLTSETVGLVPDVRTVDLGEHRLKGVGVAVGLHQLVVEGLAGDFPPVRTMGSSRSSLPRSATPLVGRDAELAVLEDALTDHRIVTLTGAGGVGKTRLAIAAAEGLGTRLADGATFVDLSTIADPDEIEPSILDALHLPRDAGLVESLTNRRIALVLDNCEHLVDAAADLVERLVAGTPDVIVLATSREPLDVQGERVVRVRGLAPKAALDLFVARAAPGAIESGADRDAVATVCDRLDHIPLAIELAAARTRSTHVRSLPDLLEDRFRLLTGGRRRTRGRQQTLEATIAWSFDLLDAEEAAALEAVAVFGGRFGVDTAARVLDVDEFLALDLIDALVARSLLEADFDDRTSMQTYSLLESIRVFAVDRLVSAGRIDDARARLCDVIIDDYLPIAGGTAHVLLHTGDVYASLDWARSVGDDERAIALDPALALCRYVDGRLDEAIETGRQTLDRVTDPRVRASLLGILAVATAYSGDLLGGRDHLDEALGIDPTDPVTLVNAFLLSPLTAGVDRERARADLALIDATAHEGAMAGIPDAQRAMIAMWDGDARSAANHAAASLASVKPRAGLRGVRSSFLGLRGIMTTMRLLALAVGPDPSEATRWLGDEPGALHLDRAELATPQGWSFRIDFDVVAAIAMLRAGERSRGHRHLGDAVAALDQRAPQPRRNHGTVAMALACAAYDGGDVATARALTSAVDVPSAGLVPGLAHLLADMEGVDDQDRDTWVRTVPIERVLLTDDAARDERDRVADDVIERLGLRS